MDGGERPLFGDRGFRAFLFDMDGTVLDSMAPFNRVWGRWAVEHGLDPRQFLPTIHGVRAVETVRRLKIEGLDPEEEAAKIAAAEISDLDGVIAIKGAKAFLDQLRTLPWAIVTSAPRLLAQGRLKAAGLPFPPVLVTSDDVSQGKPAPDCFKLAAAALGVAGDECLVFEDAAAGVQAAEAAGSAVLVVTGAHDERLATAHPTILDYQDLGVVAGADGRWRVCASALSKGAARTGEDQR